MAAVVPKSFLQPIPASQARSQAQQIIDSNREHVERAIIGGGKRNLIRILVRTQKQLEDKLAGERRRRGDDTWTAYDTEATLVLVRQELGQLAPRFRHLLAENDARAREVGAKSTAELLAHFEGRAGRSVVQGGVMRGLQVAPALALQRPELLRHATSVDRYGAHMIGVIRRELQAGMVRGATFHEMTSMLVGKRGPRGIVSMAAREDAAGVVRRTREETIQEGLLVRYRGWAERIVRTEAMASYAAGVDDDIRRRLTVYPSLKRKLIEHFDARTARDSYVAHGQVRALGEMFHDGAGREYERPPGRPNDRATLCPWLDAWSDDLASIGIR